MQRDRAILRDPMWGLGRLVLASRWQIVTRSRSDRMVA
jgi:hypothetical protein